MNHSIIDSLIKVWSAFLERVLLLFPKLMAALLVLLAGWILAALIRMIFRRALSLARFDERCENSGLALLLRRAEIPWSPTEVMAKIAFWAVFLSLAIFSMSALDMPILDHMISEFFLYLPRAFVALAVLALGFLLSNFLSRAALLLAVNEDLPAPRAVSGTVRLLVNLLAFSMAMEQLGIAKNTVTTAFAIAFGALMLGIALAFGLGGRDLAREILARRFRGEEAGPKDDFDHL